MINFLNCASLQHYLIILKTVYSCRDILDVVTLQLHESIVSTWAKSASQTRGLPARPSKVLTSNISIIEPTTSLLRSWRDVLPGLDSHSD